MARRPIISFFFLGLIFLMVTFLPINQSAVRHSDGQAKDPPPLISNPPTKQVTLHDCIIIHNDTSFLAQASAESWLGNGSSANPFIIEDYLITGNHLQLNCIDIRDTSFHFIIQDCILDNTSANGVAIYLRNVSNSQIRRNSIYFTGYGIYLRTCNNTNVQANSIFAVDYHGICQTYTNFSVISDNLVVNSTGTGTAGLYTYQGLSCRFENNSFAEFPNGMHIISMNHSTIVNNTCWNNTIAIHVMFSNHCVIANNTGIDNHSGIFLHPCTPDSKFNQIIWNYMSGGIDQNYACYEVDNLFDYNYDDMHSLRDVDQNGIGDHPNVIPGSAGAVDLHPLGAPPGEGPRFLSILRYLYSYESNYVAYDFDATAFPPGIDTWWLNDTSQFSINYYGFFWNNTPLDIGRYNLTVYVNDTLGITISTDLIIFITPDFQPPPTTPPITPTEPTIPTIFQYYMGGLMGAIIMIVATIIVIQIGVLVYLLYQRSSKNSSNGD